MDASFWQYLSSQKISIDQANQTLTVDPEQVERYYLPIAHWLTLTESPSQRRLIAIAGPPGAGKSSFCAILAAVINACAGTDNAVVVGQDGWHYPNAYLETHFTAVDGQTVSLRSIKGTPPTYDEAALRSALETMLSVQSVRFPVYSRLAHEPLPDAGSILPHHQIVLVEGNYLILNRPSWNDLLPLFDRTILIRLAREQLVDSLSKRHALGGKDEAAIIRQLNVVDLPDTDLVLNSSFPPDLLIEKSDSRRIASLQFRK
jgi:hypothetical protein